MTTRRPSFQFYPNDWDSDPALRCCSMAAQGLWLRMMCIMHNATPYGYLKIGENIVDRRILARNVGEDMGDITAWWDEIITFGVASVDENGCLYSRRMIRDEDIRQKRANCGKLGGRPKANQKQNESKHQSKIKANGKANQKQNITPSSSSSSSSSSSKETTARDLPATVPCRCGGILTKRSSKSGEEFYGHGYHGGNLGCKCTISIAEYIAERDRPKRYLQLGDPNS